MDYSTRPDRDGPEDSYPVTREPGRFAPFACGVLFFSDGAVVGTWVPFIPERAQALQLGPARLGATLLCGGLGAVLAMPLSGWLVPRLGSRAVAVAGALGFAVLLALATNATSAAQLMGLLVLFGISGAGMDVAMNAQAVAVERKTGRRILSSLHGVYSLGNVAGSFAVSAAFARRLPPRFLGAAVALCIMLATLLAAPLMQGERPVLEGVEAKGKHSFSSQLLVLGMLVLAAMVSEGAVADWSGVYLRETQRLSSGWAGVGFGVFSSLMLAGRLSGDWLAAHVGETRLLRLGAGVACLATLMIAFAQNKLVLLAGFAALGAGLANAAPLLYRSAALVPGMAAGVGLATSVGMGYAGLLAGPPLLGGLAQVLGLRAVFFALGLLCLMLGLGASVRWLNEPAKASAEHPGVF